MHNHKIVLFLHFKMQIRRLFFFFINVYKWLLIERAHAQFKLREHRIHITLNHYSRLLILIEHVKHTNVE